MHLNAGIVGITSIIEFSLSRSQLKQK